MALIKFLLISALIYYALKFIVKNIFPYWLKKQFNKMTGSTSNFANSSGEQPKKEGEVTIDHAPQDKRNSSEGEYVEFEEIKE